METLKARVTNGRLVLDQPTDLPEGTVLDLVIDDGGDDLSDEERKALDDFLLKSLRSAEEGRCSSAEEVMAALRKQR